MVTDVEPQLTPAAEAKISPHMFVRFGTADHVKRALDMLQQFNPTIEGSRSAGLITVRAPDGDIVFQAIRKNRKSWICRYHDEVFERGDKT